MRIAVFKGFVPDGKEGAKAEPLAVMPDCITHVRTIWLSSMYPAAVAVHVKDSEAVTVPGPIDEVIEEWQASLVEDAPTREELASEPR